MHDVRYALRLLAKRPLFSALIILSLGLGIGANTAIFSAINAVMLKMLPVQRPQQLRMLVWTVPTSDFPETYVESLEGSFTRLDARYGSYSLSYPAYQEIDAHNHSFDTTFAFAANDEKANIGSHGHASSATMVGVSGNFFSGMGVTPAAGRAIQPSDDAENAVPVVMISHRFWQSEFAGQLSALGSTIQVNGQPMTIVGITPAEFFGVQPGLAPDVWVTLHWYAVEEAKVENDPNPGHYLQDKRSWWVGVIGRLKPGVTETAATAELSVLFQQSLQTVSDRPTGNTVAEFGGEAGSTPQEHGPVAKPPKPLLEIVPVARGLDQLRRDFSTSLWLLMGMVGLVLLITCSNVAALLLTRATSRQKEVAVRVSLGAPRTRIIRQVFTESLLLAVAGGLAGLLIARWAGQLLVRLMSSGRSPIDLQISPDATVLAFAAAVSLLSALFFAIAPAWYASRVQPLSSLKQTGNAATSRRFLSGRILVAVQIALSFVLLVACGLFLRTLNRLQHVDLGFQQQNLTRFTVRPGLNGYSNEQLLAYYQNLQSRLSSIPGVQSASLTMHGAIGAGSSITIGKIPGYTSAGKSAEIYRHDVGPGYFETLQIPLLLGRPISEQDTSNAPKVVVINQTLAKKYFHGDNPVGHRIDLGFRKTPEPYEIVGVVRDVKYAEIRRDVPPTAYFSYAQRKDAPPFMTFEVRSQLAPANLAAMIGTVAAALDKSVPVANLSTETAVVDEVLFLERAFATLSSAFGFLALLLAAVGLYGTIAYSVAQRTNEIGIRMALGADRQKIVSMVLREMLVIVSAGMALGIPIAWFASRTLQSQLFGLSPHDAASLGIAILVIVIVSLIAGSIPARRAAHVDPMEALRYE